MDDHDKGLAHDLDTLGRRRVPLGAASLAATTLLTAWGCGDDDAAGCAIPAWHRDRDGQYPTYGLTDQDSRRDVQETVADGCTMALKVGLAA